MVEIDAQIGDGGDDSDLNGIAKPDSKSLIRPCTIAPHLVLPLELGPESAELCVCDSAWHDVVLKRSD